MAPAGFEREPDLPLRADRFGRLWANSHLEFAASEMRGWLRGLEIRFFPLPAWAERLQLRLCHRVDELVV